MFIRLVTRLVCCLFLTFALGADCATVPEAMPPPLDQPAEIPAVEEPPPEAPPTTLCFTRFFHDETGAGFNPPRDFIGPVFSEIELPEGQVFAKWQAPFALVTSFTFWSSPFSYSLEQLASSKAQTAQGLVFVNEPLVLNSGQPGWVVASRTTSGLLFVSVFLKTAGRAQSVGGTGANLDGTDDFDTLLGTCRTLCAVE